MWSPPFLAIVSAGLAAAVGQVLILRELLVLFLGNELSTGLVFFSWLFWTGAGSAAGASLSRHGSIGRGTLAASLITLALVLPSTLLWIRGSRIVWSIPKGELVQPGLMAAIAFSTTSVFCMVSGALFAFAWASKSESREPGAVDSTVIYLGEAAGSALGGLLFYFVLLPRVTAFEAALLVSTLLLGSGAVMLGKVAGGSAGKSLLMAAAAGAGACLFAAGYFLNDLEMGSRKAQWGEDILAVRDSPFHNFALLRRAEQFTLFANGQWLFSVPDPQTAEFSVQPALLHHPAPQDILLIGGGVAGLVREILKHPTVQVLDYVEPDPEVIRVAEEFLPPEETQVLRDPRVRILHGDAGSMVRRLRKTYDVILSNVGDPLNAGSNRFYTREFFERLRRLLRPGGIVTFAVTSSPDVVGTKQARFLQSLRAALQSAFPHVLIYPGESARFMASDDPRVLEVNPGRLVHRIRERRLELQYVQDFSIRDRMNPMRVAALQSVLQSVEGPSPPVNEDFRPSCYYYGLAVWSAQVHPALGSLFTAAADMNKTWTWFLVAACSLGILGASTIGRPRPRRVVALCVLLVGGGQMALQVLLLVAFQILEGFVYRELALIITVFMGGIALGAALAGRRKGAGGFPEGSMSAWTGIVSTGSGDDGSITRNRMVKVPRIGSFLAVQILFAAALLFVMGILHLLHQGGKESLAPFPVSGVFAALALVAGLLGGIHFTLAVAFVEAIDPGAETGRGGPTLYAFDLLGAAGGLSWSPFISSPSTESAKPSEFSPWLPLRAPCPSCASASQAHRNRSLDLRFTQPSRCLEFCGRTSRNARL